ncbi:MAG: DUF4148 domain-containing protein [Polaromonas sp.]
MNISLKTRLASVTAFVVAAVAAGNVLAQEDMAAPKTRAQVQAELLDAQRMGNIVSGEDGRMLNELNPGRYPAKAASSGRTRADVQAELLDAQRRGDIMSDDSGQKLNELYPNRYKGAGRLAE